MVRTRQGRSRGAGMQPGMVGDVYLLRHGRAQQDGVPPPPEWSQHGRHSATTNAVEPLRHGSMRAQHSTAGHKLTWRHDGVAHAGNHAHHLAGGRAQMAGILFGWLNSAAGRSDQRSSGNEHTQTVTPPPASAIAPCTRPGPHNPCRARAPQAFQGTRPVAGAAPTCPMGPIFMMLANCSYMILQQEDGGKLGGSWREGRCCGVLLRGEMFQRGLHRGGLRWASAAQGR